jgi:GNAT superfamily N-acetyltransferase
MMCGMSQMRVAEPSDAEAIAVVHVEAWRWAYRGLVPDAFLDSLSVDARRRLWEGALESDESPQRVLVWDEAPLGAPTDVRGFVSYGPARDPKSDAAEIYAIYVTERDAGRGIGTALHDEALHALREAGYDRALVWLLEINERGRAFYARHGWAPDGASEQRPFGDEERVEIRLARTL